MSQVEIKRQCSYSLYCNFQLGVFTLWWLILTPGHIKSWQKLHKKGVFPILIISTQIFSETRPRIMGNVLISKLDLGEGHNIWFKGFRRIIGIPSFKTNILGKFSNLWFEGFQRTIEIPAIGTMFIWFFWKYFLTMFLILKVFCPHQNIVFLILWQKHIQT